MLVVSHLLDVKFGNFETSKTGIVKLYFSLTKHLIIQIIFAKIQAHTKPLSGRAEFFGWSGSKNNYLEQQLQRKMDLTELKPCQSLYF